jgi:hypothetical protein
MLELHLDNLPVDATPLASAFSPSLTDCPPKMPTIDGLNNGTVLKMSMPRHSEAAISTSLEDSMHTHQNPSHSFNPITSPLPPIPTQTTITSEPARTTGRPISNLTCGTGRTALQHECDQLSEQMARMESSMQISTETSAAQIGSLANQIILLSRQLSSKQGHAGIRMFTDTPLMEGELPPGYD